MTAGCGVIISSALVVNCAVNARSGVHKGCCQPTLQHAALPCGRECVMRCTEVRPLRALRFAVQSRCLQKPRGRRAFLRDPWFSVLCYPEASRSSLFKPCHRPLRGRLVLCSVIFHPHLTPRYTTPGTRREINDLRINLGCGKLSRTAAITRRQLCVFSNLLS